MIDYAKLQEQLRAIPGLLEGFQSMQEEIRNALQRHEDSVRPRTPTPSHIHTLHDSPRSSPLISRAGAAAEHRRTSSTSGETMMDEQALALTFYAMGFKARVNQEKERAAAARAIQAAYAEPIYSNTNREEEVAAGCCCFIK